MKLLVIITILLLIVCFTVISFNHNEKTTVKEKYYHGPIPLGYDTEYFRKTGETILEADE